LRVRPGQINGAGRSGFENLSLDAVRYNGTIHDFVLLNALRHEASAEAAIAQANAGVRRHLSSGTN